jgi:hypothetical protein
LPATEIRRRHNEGVRLPAILTALLAACALAATPASGGGGAGDSSTAFGYGKNPRYARALKFCDIQRGDAALRSCLSKQLFQLVLDSHDSATELPRIDAYLATAGGFAQRNCHLLMHAVGRRYGAAVHLTVGRLLEYLPRTNNANCSAGFGHGLLIYLAPQVGAMTPDAAAAACDRAATRYQRYSCVHGFGHAYMRLYAEQLPFALHSCRLLGRDNAADCAAGAFHDYWIAVSGLDHTRRPANLITSPRVLCAKSSGGFVRGCWYRALLEHPPAKALRTAASVLSVCRGLTGTQRGACITAAAVVSASDPFTQMDLCQSLRRSEASDCVRGVRAPELGRSPMSVQIRLIRRCANVYHPAQAACYRWLGTALNVITNGKFADGGCGSLTYAATRDACEAGADAYEGPLETFS